MLENHKLRVFLCHSKDDKPKVRELYRRLVADGFDAWLDEEKLMPGQDWDLEIRKSVRESDVVVVCLSGSSVTKVGYVQKEIRFALDVADEQPEGAIFLIPVRLEDCQVPVRLNRWQWVDMFDGQGYQKLKVSLDLRAKNLGRQKEIIVPYEITGLPFEPKMMRIDSGPFLMGSTLEQAEISIIYGSLKGTVEAEYPQHVVELAEYYIGKYPVTNQEYQYFLEETAYHSPSDWDRYRYPLGKDLHPVTKISWNDAVAYCEWLSKKANKFYRLSTEAEWEKAARGIDGRIYPWGKDFKASLCNVKESNIDDTTPVGQFSPQGDSPYGCADMIGNVWEWCSDWYGITIYKTRSSLCKNPYGPDTGSYRVLRGGSFDFAGRPRCALRFGFDPYFWRSSYGFRIVYSLH